MANTAQTHSEYFLRVNELLAAGNSRDSYYIAKEIIERLERPNPPVDLNQKPFKEPLFGSFYFLLRKSRFEDAAKLYDLGLKNHFNPVQLIGVLKKRALRAESKAKGDIKKNAELESYVFLDEVITFFAKLGYESEFRDAADGELSRRNDISEHIAASWVVLLSQFMSDNTIESRAQFLQKLSAYCLRHYNYAQGIEGQARTIDFRRYLLKRQILTLYVAISIETKNRRFLFSPKQKPLLERAARVLEQAYLNYCAIMALSVERTAERAQQIIRDAEDADIWHEDSVIDYAARIGNIKKRLSDFGDLFERMFGAGTDLGWISELSDAIKEILRRVEDENANLDRAAEAVRQRVAEKMADDACNIEAARIRTAFMRENGLPWRVARERITDERLKVLAISLDNAYSSESVFFFKDVSAKIEYDPIERNYTAPATELHILKKWGSSASVFERNKKFNASFGGGFFLYHQGHGIAIDPGPDFLKNLTSFTDFDLFDLHSIVCTHIHLDHIGDVVRVMNGIREYNEQVGSRRLRLLLVDEDDHAMIPQKMRERSILDVLHEPARFSHPSRPNSFFFPDYESRENGIEIIPVEVTHGIYRHAKYLTEADESDVCKREESNRRLNIEEYGGRKTLNDKGWRTWSHGLVLKLRKKGRLISTLFFTGDMQFDMRSEIYSYKADIAVLNVGSVRFKDVIAIPIARHAKPDKEDFKKNHLGYSGTVSLLKKSPLTKNVKCSRLNILDEFFEVQSEADARPFIASSVQRDISEGAEGFARVLTGETGTRIKIDRSGTHLFCSAVCGDRGFIALRSGIRECRPGLFSRTARILPACPECVREKENEGWIIF